MRVAMKLFAIGCLMCALAACSRQPSLDRATLRSIAAEATALLDTAPTSNDISVPNLPTALKALNPERARADPDGLYITTGTLFVAEWGYFVPRNKAAFDPRLAGGEPAFRHLGEGVYWYEVKG